MSAAWLSWLKDSLFTFHQFPTWSPLWMGGMPFFGMVPPGVFYMMTPFYLLTGSTATAYNLAIVIMFLMSGLSMYLYLRHLSGSSFPAFLGATIYVVLPVHIGSMMFWGLFEILCAYAVMPLALLFTDLLLERRAGRYLFLAATCLGFILLTQIEFAFIFLLLYVPYFVFSLFLKGVGWRQLLLIVTTNRAWVMLTLLALLVPLWFYVSVITQYHDFAGLQPYEIEEGLRHFTFEHFGDTFLLKADSIADTWLRPATEHYTGPISFVILLLAMLLVAFDSDKKRVARLLFFLVTAMAFLLLTIGIYGPLFPLMRELIPVLQGMRVTLRFYYCFALCVPIVFTLCYVSSRELHIRIPRISFKPGPVMWSLASAILVMGLVLDFAPYFDYFHHRVVDREQYDKQREFLRETLSQDNFTEGSTARVLIYPWLGLNTEYMTLIQDGDASLSAELTSSSLPWNQYADIVDYYAQTSDGITQDDTHLRFYSTLLAIDYFGVYVSKIPPGDVMSTEYQKQKISALNSLSDGIDQPLASKGSLDTDYYTVSLYRVLQRSPQIRFHPASTSLMLLSDDVFVSHALFHSYEEVSDVITARAFLDRVVAVSSRIEDAAASSHTAVSLEKIPLLMSGQSETNDPSTEIDNLRLTAKGLSVDVNAADEGILSLTYYYNPWWKVFIDGEEALALRVNGIFAGTHLGPGQHHVEFLYDYPSLPNVISRLWR